MNVQKETSSVTNPVVKLAETLGEECLEHAEQKLQWA